MQNFRNRKYVQNCSQNAESNIVKTNGVIYLKLNTIYRWYGVQTATVTFLQRCHVQRNATFFRSCHSPSIAAYRAACCCVFTKLPQRVAAFLQSCHSVLRRFYKAATAWCRVSTKLSQRVVAFLQSCHCMLRRFHGCISFFCSRCPNSFNCVFSLTTNRNVSGRLFVQLTQILTNLW